MRKVVALLYAMQEAMPLLHVARSVWCYYTRREVCGAIVHDTKGGAVNCWKELSCVYESDTFSVIYINYRKIQELYLAILLSCYLAIYDKTYFVGESWIYEHM